MILNKNNNSLHTVYKSVFTFALDIFFFKFSNDIKGQETTPNSFVLFPTGNH